MQQISCIQNTFKHCCKTNFPTTGVQTVLCTARHSSAPEFKASSTDGGGAFSETTSPQLKLV